nr:MAG TPA: Heat shock protein beta-1, ALA-LEU-SER-ARG-GLN-fold, sHSP, CHAPERONE.1A [Caudoviricetes sp.]
MKLNPYKQIRFNIDKQTGMLRVHLPDIIKDEVSIEIDDHELNITIK